MEHHLELINAQTMKQTQPQGQANVENLAKQVVAEVHHGVDPSRVSKEQHSELTIVQTTQDTQPLGQANAEILAKIVVVEVNTMDEPPASQPLTKVWNSKESSQNQVVEVNHETPQDKEYQILNDAEIIPNNSVIPLQQPDLMVGPSTQEMIPPQNQPSHAIPCTTSTEKAVVCEDKELLERLSAFSSLGTHATNNVNENKDVL
ncbi:hypothetical protein ACH5RR_033762 [Cinchona calisaya]|uniref:Uncharacterized protein n=1 Tax=Cinchona calisaya TaxID=153742 RepID=A0ABD2YB59_9GENT